MTRFADESEECNGDVPKSVMYSELPSRFFTAFLSSTLFCCVVALLVILLCCYFVGFVDYDYYTYFCIIDFQRYCDVDVDADLDEDDDGVSKLCNCLELKPYLVAYIEVNDDWTAFTARMTGLFYSLHLSFDEVRSMTVLMVASRVSLWVCYCDASRPGMVTDRSNGDAAL